jgi:hypothetical protein
LFATANPFCGRQKFPQALAADFFSDASMENFNRVTIDLAANCRDAMAISSGLIA